MATITVSPGQSIQAAVAAASPGDAILVEPGVYNETVSIMDSNLTLRSTEPWGAILDSGNSKSEAIRITGGAEGVTVEGFEIRNYANASGSGTGIELYTGGKDAKILNNHVHHIGRVCTGTSNGECGIYAQQSGVVIEGNYIHDIGRFAPGEQGCNPPNAYYQNHDHGIYLSAGSGSKSGVRVRNNFFGPHERGWAIQVYPGTWSDVEIVDNIFAGGNPYRGNSMVILASSLSNSLIARNTFYEPTQGFAIQADGSFSGLRLENNVVTQADLTYPDPAGISMSGNQLNAQLEPPQPPGPGDEPEPPPPPPGRQPPVLSVGEVTNVAVTLKWPLMDGVSGFDFFKDSVKVSSGGAAKTSVKFGALPPTPVTLGVMAKWPDGYTALAAKVTKRAVE